MHKHYQYHIYRGLLCPGMMVDYTYPKGAVMSLNSLAKHLLLKGIRTNAVAPGQVRPRFLSTSRLARETEGFREVSRFGRSQTVERNRA